MIVLDGHVLTPQGFVEGRIRLAADGRIADVSGSPVEPARVRDSKRRLVLPGFIDLHPRENAASTGARAASLNATHGTTALLATAVVESIEDLEQALRGLAPVFERRRPGSARVLGVRLAAQPHFAGKPDVAALRRLDAVAPVRVVTLAAGMPGHLEAIASLRAAGYRVQVAQGIGTYQQGVEALGAGAQGLTDILDAMEGLHHRNPGMVTAALAHAEFSEITPDLRRAHPATLGIALRAIPKMYCVTDSAVLTLGQALRNLVEAVGLALDEASMRVSTNAADYLGLADRGRLARGAWADVVVMDRDLVLQDVYVEGERVTPTQ